MKRRGQSARLVFAITTPNRPTRVRGSGPRTLGRGDLTEGHRARDGYRKTNPAPPGSHLPHHIGCNATDAFATANLTENRRYSSPVRLPLPIAGRRVTTRAAAALVLSAEFVVLDGPGSPEAAGRVGRCVRCDLVIIFSTRASSAICEACICSNHRSSLCVKSALSPFNLAAAAFWRAIIFSTSRM